MVRTSFCNFCKTVILRPSYRKSKFTDSLYFQAKGGAGGNGLPKYGGFGGRGGNVVCVAKENSSLDALKSKMKAKLFTAASGDNSISHCLVGKSGEDKILEVPPGITAYNEFGTMLGELNAVDDFVVLAEGGQGGNAQNGWMGRKGQSVGINLELKLIADVGLVGFPNAGKSTFLKAISKAKPKIASYPFTTIKPNIGIVNFEDLRKISIADLPGLIEGAYKNKGMGHKFLRHIERTKLIAIIVDVNGFQLSSKYPRRSCVETVLLLNKELELYKKTLLLKPIILIVNKMDISGANGIYRGVEDTLHNLKDHIHKYSDEFQPNQLFKFHAILPISAKTSKEDISVVKEKIRNLLDIYAEDESEFVKKERNLITQLKAMQKEVGTAIM